MINSAKSTRPSGWSTGQWIAKLADTFGKLSSTHHLTLEHVMDRTLDLFTAAYVEAALWSSNDDSDVPLDKNYDVDDIADETLQRMIDDCKKFQAEQFPNGIPGHWSVRHYTGEYSLEAYAGHDFWLTRNGHGAGFWDGDWRKDIGRKLTDASKVFGQVDLYVGDDGKIYA